MHALNHSQCSSNRNRCIDGQISLIDVAGETRLCSSNWVVVWRIFPIRTPQSRAHLSVVHTIRFGIDQLGHPYSLCLTWRACLRVIVSSWTSTYIVVAVISSRSTTMSMFGCIKVRDFSNALLHARIYFIPSVPWTWMTSCHWLGSDIVHWNLTAVF